MGKNIKNKIGSIKYSALQLSFNVSQLRRGQLIVKNYKFNLILVDVLLNLLKLTASKIGLGIWFVEVLYEPLLRFGPCSFGKKLKFVQILSYFTLFLIIVDDDMKITSDLIISTEDNKNLGVEIKEYVQGRKEEVVEEEDIPFMFVEEKPKFQGGDEHGFTKWVAERLVYPEIAKENGVQGRVTLSFRVNTDGSVSDVKVLRGVDPSLDKEAVRVVSMSPKWTPGRQRNKAVRVIYTFPVIFQLR